MNELTWFVKYQASLLQLANTNEGRDLLCIDPWHAMPFQVIALQKNMVRYYLGRDSEKDYFLSDFRVGAKWGNVIRYRWRDVERALDRFQSVLRWPRIDSRGLVIIAGGTTTTVYPDPDPESTTVDGGVARLDEGGGKSFGDIRGGAGTSATPSSSNATPFDITSTSTTNEWSRIQRGIYLFDTSSISADDTISSGTLSLYGNDKTDAYTSSLIIVDSTPASNTDIVSADYSQLGTTDQAAAITHADASTSAYNDFTLNATGRGNIAQGSGVSKFGGRDFYDDEGTSGPTWQSAARSYFSHWFAEDSGTSRDPKLVVVHAAFQKRGTTGSTYFSGGVAVV